MSRFAAAVVLLSGGMAMATSVSPPGQPQSASLFAFGTDDFWLNLHHFLYVLGRAHRGAPDAAQIAVAGAPDEEKQGLALLSDDERQVWDKAVQASADGLSRQSSVFQRPLSTMTIALGKTGDVAAFPASLGPMFDTAVREMLERAAPVYRKAWWARHHAMNQQYVARLQQQLDREGPAIARELSRIYQLPWPERPYPTAVVAYANWQGAFSYTGELMVLSSNANAQNEGWFPLESVFHEAMHQWDDKVDQALRVQAAGQGVAVAQDLSHVLLFYKVGYVLHQRHPGHEPLIDAANIWRGTLSGATMPVARLRPQLEGAWKAYLEGTGTRDEAFAAMVAAAAR
jgi:hypothetical protein